MNLRWCRTTVQQAKEKLLGGERETVAVRTFGLAISARVCIQEEMDCGHVASSTNSCKISKVAIAATLRIPFFSFQNLYAVLPSGGVNNKDHCNEWHENGQRKSEDDANEERLFLPDANHQAN